MSTPKETHTSAGLRAAQLLTERLLARQTRHLRLGNVADGDALFADTPDPDTTQPAVMPNYDGLGLANVANLIAASLGAPLPDDAVSPVTLEALTEPLTPAGRIGEAELAALTLDARLCHLTGLDGQQRYRKRSYPRDDSVLWPPLREVVLLIVDAMGFTQLLAQVEAGRLPTFARLIADPRNVAAPLTSAYPSTTTTVLSSYATGRTPQEHGVMATNVWLREVGEMVNLIGYQPQAGGSVIPDRVLNPDSFLPVETIYSHLERHSVKCRQVNYGGYLNSSMSRMNIGAAEEVEISPYVANTGLFVQLRQMLERDSFDPTGGHQSPKRFTYAYISSLDTTAHRYGPMTEFYDAEFAAIDFALGHELIGRLNRPDALLLIVADHGQVVIGSERCVYLNDDPDIAALLRNRPGGERRTPYLYVDTADRPRLMALLRERYGDKLSSITREQAFDLGLFGAADPHAPGGRRDPRAVSRVGEVVVFPKPGWQVQWKEKDDRVDGWGGAHGGLSADEMITPLIALRLGNSQ